MSTDSKSSLGRAEACANIALAKYWGKSDRGDNLTATSSLSLTLDSLRTRTEVSFDPSLETDTVTLDGEVIEGRPTKRVVEMLDKLRTQGDISARARVVTSNNFPTAAGLASSASGFAALAVAASQAAGVSLSTGSLSSLARQSSASAGRSLFGGFAELKAETDQAETVAPSDHWDVAMVVAVVTAGKKPISSTGGMLHTAKTSPYYPAWVTSSPAIFEEVRAGVLTRDFERVAINMEHSTRLMHSTMITSLPPVLYLRGATVELMHEVAARRAAGDSVAYTMDAGPNVKVFTTGAELNKTVDFLKSFEGVSDVIVCRPGPAASRLALDGPLNEAARTEVLS